MRQVRKWLSAFLVALLCFSGISTLADSLETNTVGDIYDAPIAQSDVLHGRIVFVDPGHGTGCGGASEGYIEATYNLLYAELLRDKLETLGATVVMTRETAANVENYHRMANVHIYTLQLLKNEYAAIIEVIDDEAEKAKLRADIAEMTRLQGVMQTVLDDISLADTYFNSPYDYSYQTQIHSDLQKIFEYEEHPLVRRNMLYISIHSNGPANPSNTSVNGTVAYYLDNEWHCIQNYYTEYHNVDYAERMARLLADKVSEAGEFNNRGIAVNDFFMLREHNLPAALIEMAYHSNPSDRAKLKDPYYQNRITTAMALSAVEYFESISLYAGIAEGEFFSSINYMVDGDMLMGVAPDTRVSALLGNIISTCELRVKDIGGSIKPNTALVVTGDKLELLSGNEVLESYIIPVKGDCNADGQAGLVDLLMIQKELLSIERIDAPERRIAADLDGSGSIGLVDLLKLQKHLLGLGTLN